MKRFEFQSKADLARWLGVDRTTISHWARRKIPYRVCILLAKQFGFDPDEIRENPKIVFDKIDENRKNNQPASSL